jgi:hypothetical protein
MNDLLRIDGWENGPAPGWGVAGETDMGVGGEKGKKRKEGTVDSLCPSCHGIAIADFSGWRTPADHALLTLAIP